MSQRFEGKNVIITGAAGGIGSAACKRLATEGANVIAVDLGASDPGAVTAAVESAGGRALAVAADLSVEADVRNYMDAGMTKTAAREWGGQGIRTNASYLNGAIVPVDGGSQAA